jgi:acyl-CoA synthetase (AMP-forming)/AMP-acid ligase II
MGLIGCLVTPVVNRSDLWLLRPEHFVHRPLRYLRCFGADGARLTAMPSFGLGFTASRVDSAMLEGLDFADWRAIIVGAERLDVRTLDRFQRLLEPFGLRRTSLLPSYGLAEATLAVTGLPLEEEWTHYALVHESATGAPQRNTRRRSLDVVGCGRPLGDVAVTIVDGQGRAVPEGAVGEIVVTGTSVAAGYVDDGPSPSLTAFAERGLETGDAGLLLDGQLFVLGRLGDSLKIRGRTVFAEDLEAALVAEGVAPNRIVTLLGVSEAGVTVVALFEEAQTDWLRIAESTLRGRVDGAAIVVLDGPRGTISRTSSHKPRRRELWEAFLGGRLPSRTVLVGKPYCCGGASAGDRGPASHCSEDVDQVPAVFRGDLGDRRVGKADRPQAPRRRVERELSKLDEVRTP